MPSAGPRRTALLAVGCALALLLVVAAAEWVPRLLGDSVAVTSTPVPDEMPQPAALPLGPGQRACLREIAIDPASERVRIALRPEAAQPTPPLQVEIDGPGYRFRSRAQQTDPAEPRLTLPLTPPERALPATVCVRNVGTTATELDATADPRVFEQSGRAVVDDVTQPSSFLLTFTEAEPSSPLDRLPQTIRRAALFSAAGPWLFWLLLPLVFVGVPALVLGALQRSLRDAGDEGA